MSVVQLPVPWEPQVLTNDEGTVYSDPVAPLRVARELAAQRQSTDGTPHDAWWRDDPYQWVGTKWVVVEPTAVRKWIYVSLEDATYRDSKGATKDWNPSSRSVSNVIDALSSAVLYRSGLLDCDTVIACTNGVYDVETNRLTAHHPSRFNLASLPYAYNSAEDCPEWESFLMDVLPDDEEARIFLQEWFGYLVSGRTDQQKICSLIGPPRCGKGTIARIAEAMLGPQACASPSISKLGAQFGEQPLIGKGLAVMGDVRWNVQSVAEAVPVLLGISGEDSRNIDRKNREDWHGKLGVRFMIMSNDEPRFNESSAALSQRMIHIEFRRTWLGNEDVTLTDRLLEELPGILNWSLEGLRRLTARGHFLVPESSRAVSDVVESLSSHERTFVREMCVLAPGHETPMASLFKHFAEWCRDPEQGVDKVPVQSVFARNLRSAFRSELDFKRAGKAKTNVVIGLKYVGRAEWADVTCECPEAGHGAHTSSCQGWAGQRIANTSNHQVIPGI